jgi:hypothetical protein
VLSLSVASVQYLFNMYKDHHRRPAAPPHTPFEDMPAFLEPSSMNIPLVVRETIMSFLYSFDFNAFKERYIRVAQVYELRPFLPQFEIANVPGIEMVRAHVRAPRAVARAEKYALTRMYSQ